MVGLSAVGKDGLRMQRPKGLVPQEWESSAMKPEARPGVGLAAVSREVVLLSARVEFGPHGHCNAVTESGLG